MFLGCSLDVCGTEVRWRVLPECLRVLEASLITPRTILGKSKILSVQKFSEVGIGFSPYRYTEAPWGSSLEITTSIIYETMFGSGLHFFSAREHFSGVGATAAAFRALGYFEVSS